MTVCDATL